MQPFSLNINGRLHRYDKPVVMAILNITTDSFYSSSRATCSADIEAKARQLIEAGADIIDIGAYSSRHGTGIRRTNSREEYECLARGIEAVRKISTDITISVDTFRAQVARKAIALSANIINDISGLSDPDMLPTLVDTGAPYILMHMRGTPDTMEQKCEYPDGVTAGVISELSHPLRALEKAGVKDVIIDPGFGFSKDLAQNHTLLRELPAICALGYPVLVGISRKSMITKPLGITPEEALPGTCALNALAVEFGASILRVHDPLEASQIVKLCNFLK